jgi:hypothetical protein
VDVGDTTAVLPVPPAGVQLNVTPEGAVAVRVALCPGHMVEESGVTVVVGYGPTCKPAVAVPTQPSAFVAVTV